MENVGNADAATGVLRTEGVTALSPWVGGWEGDREMQAMALPPRHGQEWQPWEECDLTPCKP